MSIKKQGVNNRESPLEAVGARHVPPIIEQTPQIEAKLGTPEIVTSGEQVETPAAFKKSQARQTASASPAPQPKSELLLEVEDILADDLALIYQKMTPENQRRFKAKGEEVARTIWQMIETAKLQLKKILTLLREWLKMIPGVNRYFLEQETKIKIDKIIELAHKQKH